MLKASLFLILLQVFCIFQLVAQPHEIKPLKDKQTEVHIIALKYAELGVIKTLNIKIDSIIDNRINKEHFGIVMMGMSNRRVSTTLSDGTSGLKKYINHSIRYDKDAIPITLVINHFWLSEQSVGLKNVSNCEADILFCKKNQDGKLVVLDEFSEALEEESFKDLTNSLPKLIKKFLDIAFEQFTQEELSTQSNKILDELNQNERKSFVFHKDSLRVGVFPHFIDLYMGRATKKEHLRARKPALRNDVEQLIDTISYKIIKKYYAFYDGNDVYLNAFAYGQWHSNYYKKIVSYGRYMLVDDIFTDPYLNAATSQLGLLGIIISVSSIKHGMVVDMKTGKPIMLSDKTIVEILSPYPELVKKYKKVPHEYRTFNLKRGLIETLNKLESAKNTQ